MSDKCYICNKPLSGLLARVQHICAPPEPTATPQAETTPNGDTALQGSEMADDSIQLKSEPNKTEAAPREVVSIAWGHVSSPTIFVEKSALDAMTAERDSALRSLKTVENLKRIAEEFLKRTVQERDQLRGEVAELKEMGTVKQRHRFAEENNALKEELSAMDKNFIRVCEELAKLKGEK